MLDLKLGLSLAKIRTELKLCQALVKLDLVGKLLHTTVIIRMSWSFRLSLAKDNNSSPYFVSLNHRIKSVQSV